MQRVAAHTPWPDHKGGLVSLSLESRQVGDITVVKCNGRIVAGDETTAFQQHLDDLPPHDPFLLLDLAEVHFVDSAGLGFLARLVSRTQSGGGQLKLCGVPPRLREVLRVTRLETMFESYESEADAILAFYQRGKAAATASRLNNEILCVESSLDVLAYVRELLAQAGYGVMTANNLPDALTLLNATQPKVIVMSAQLRSTRGTRAADAFNALADQRPVVELPTDFSVRDAGEAGRRLLEAVQALIGNPTGRPSGEQAGRPS